MSKFLDTCSKFGVRVDFVTPALVAVLSLTCSSDARAAESKTAAGASSQTKQPVSKPVAASQKPAGKMVEGLLIKHYSWLGGVVDIAVTPQYLSISNPTRSGVTVSQAPFKTVIAYDSSKKTYYETKPEAAGSFMIQRFLKLLGGDPHPQNWRKVEEKTIAGVKAGRYVVATGTAPKKHEKGEKVITQMRYNGFWVAENLPVPPGAADIVLKMEGFPLIHKMPLLFEDPEPDPDARGRVNTFSVKKMSFPEARFKVPSGYRKAGAEYSLQSEELELFSVGDHDAGKGKK